MIGKSILFVVTGLTSLVYFVSLENVSNTVETADLFSDSYQQTEMSNYSSSVALMSAEELKKALSAIGTGTSIQTVVATLNNSGTDANGMHWRTIATYDESDGVITLKTLVSKTVPLPAKPDSLINLTDSTIVKLKRGVSIAIYKLYSYNYDIGDSTGKVLRTYKKKINGVWKDVPVYYCVESNSFGMYRWRLSGNSDMFTTDISNYYKYSYFSDAYNTWQKYDSLDGRGKIAIDCINVQSSAKGSARRQFSFSSPVYLRGSVLNFLKTSTYRDQDNYSFGAGSYPTKKINSPIYKKTYANADIKHGTNPFWTSMPIVKYGWDSFISPDNANNYNVYLKNMASVSGNGGGGRIITDSGTGLISVKFLFANNIIKYRYKLKSGSWKPSAVESEYYSKSISQFTPNGLIYIEHGNAYVHGVIDGRVTIYASQAKSETEINNMRIRTPMFFLKYTEAKTLYQVTDSSTINPQVDSSFNSYDIGGIIVLDDDIKYANPNVTNLNTNMSDDALGLIAERLVVVKYIPGKKTWNVQAAICVPKDIGTLDIGNDDAYINKSTDWINGLYDVRRNAVSFLFDRLLDYTFRYKNGGTKTKPVYGYSTFNLTGSLAICSPVVKPIVFGSGALKNFGFTSTTSFAAAGFGLKWKISCDERFYLEAILPPFYPILASSFEIFSFKE